MPVPNIVPPNQDTPIGYSPNSFGAVATIVGLTSGGSPLPARLREYAMYANAAATTIFGVGSTIATFGATHTPGLAEPDSIYDDMVDASGAGATVGLGGDRGIELRFQPIHWEAQIRSSAIAQTNWRLWIGLFGQLPAALANSDALGAVLGIAFRFHKTVETNIQFAVNDATVQTVVDTGIPFTEGPAAQNTYRLSLDITASVISWAVQNLTSGVQASGSVAVPALFNTSTRLSPIVSVTDIDGVAKELLIAKMLWSFR